MKTFLLIITLWVVTLGAVLAQVNQQVIKPDTANVASPMYKGSNAPLYVISSHNKQFALDSTMRAPDIDPKWIESIKILKGNRGTDLYGKKAEYGVVIINIKDEECPQAFKTLRKEMKKIKPKSVPDNLNRFSFL